MKMWNESASTILFVTHDVAEAVYLADHLYVVSARPGYIADEIRIPFARPRDESLKEQPQFRELENLALASLRRAAGGVGGEVRVTV